MLTELKILVAQTNPIVGDIEGNIRLVKQVLQEYSSDSIDIAVFPELCVVGYPPEDLVLKPSLVRDAMNATELLRSGLPNNGSAVIVGTPWIDEGQLFNASVVLRDGNIIAKHYKYELPNYSVHDEKRLYQRGNKNGTLFVHKDVKVGIAICEDVWYRTVPKNIKAQGADLLIIPNASQWRRNVMEERIDALDEWQGKSLPYIYVNQVGGQDELVHDGASYAVGRDGTHHHVAPNFQPSNHIITFNNDDGQFIVDSSIQVSRELEADYSAAVLGLRDYVNKNKFPTVVIGLSGGIDSALTACIAVDAIGSDRVFCVMMPSRYTSQDSLTDAEECAKNLKVDYQIVSIEQGVSAVDDMLSKSFEGTEPDVTEENIQSRLRGLLLMAFSNKFGHLLVTTGNKSELAVGYATLYGDMCGGFNALKDLYKTEVFSLSRWRNQNIPAISVYKETNVIPTSIIDKPPSAELKADQKDEDSLPPYDVLDDILRGLVDDEKGIEEIVDSGHDETTVRRIENLLYLSEYKRRQGAIGTKIGYKNFGRDRRYPITNRYRNNVNFTAIEMS